MDPHTRGRFLDLNIHDPACGIQHFHKHEGDVKFYASIPTGHEQEKTHAKKTKIQWLSCQKFHNGMRSSFGGLKICFLITDSCSGTHAMLAGFIQDKKAYGFIWSTYQILKLHSLN